MKRPALRAFWKTLPYSERLTRHVAINGTLTMFAIEGSITVAGLQQVEKFLAVGVNRHSMRQKKGPAEGAQIEEKTGTQVEVKP